MGGVAGLPHDQLIRFAGKFPVDGAYVIAGGILSDVKHFAGVAALAVLHHAVASRRAQCRTGKLDLHLLILGVDHGLHRGKKVQPAGRQVKQVLHAQGRAGKHQPPALPGCKGHRAGGLAAGQRQGIAQFAIGFPHGVGNFQLQCDAPGRQQRAVCAHDQIQGQVPALLPAGAGLQFHMQCFGVQPQQQRQHHDHGKDHDHSRQQKRLAKMVKQGSQRKQEQQPPQPIPQHRLSAPPGRRGGQTAGSAAAGRGRSRRPRGPGDAAPDGGRRHPGRRPAHPQE